MTTSDNGNGTAPAPPLRGSLILGAAWMIATKWGVRFLGIVSTLILARLLIPEDFGLAAMTMVLVSSVNILFEFGVDYALITNRNSDAELLDTCWTLRFLQAIGAGLIILLLTPFVGYLYDDARVAPLLAVVAIATIIRGSTNIGIVLFRKELEFHKEFYFELSTKLIAITGTVALAYYLRNYWALIGGILIAYCAEVVLSFAMHPFRPGWTLKRFSEIWSFSKWMLATHIGNHVATRIDRLLVGALGGPHLVGHYAIGGEIANMAGPEITAPVSRALIPGFSKLRDEPQRLDRAYLKSLAAAAMIGIPSSVGLALTAPELIPIALGPNWGEAIPIVQILCLFALLRTLVTASSVLNLVSGHVDRVAKISLIRAFLTPPVVAGGYAWMGIFGVAVAKVVLVLYNFAAISRLVIATRDIKWHQIIDTVWRPISATAFMAGAIEIYIFSLNAQSPAVVLCTKVAIGIATYSVSLIVLWLVAGKPNGVERDLLDMAKIRLEKVRRN